MFGCDRGPESRVQTLFFALAEAVRLENEAAKNKSVPGFPQWGFEVRVSPEAFLKNESEGACTIAINCQGAVSRAGAGIQQHYC